MRPAEEIARLVNSPLLPTIDDTVSLDDWANAVAQQHDFLSSGEQALCGLAFDLAGWKPLRQPWSWTRALAALDEQDRQVVRWAIVSWAAAA